MAALVYFRKEVSTLIKTLFNYSRATQEMQKLFNFLLVTTLISGVLGLFFYKLSQGVSEENITSQAVNLVVGVLLLVTAGLQFRAQKIKEGSFRSYSEISRFDNILLGLVQSMAVFPGLSRSGLTVSALLIRKFDEQTALKMSFLMSLPIVLGGNLLLNFDKFTLSLENFLGVGLSFVFGLLTIKFLLKLAEKINFAYFVLIFAFLTITAAFV